MTVVWFTLKSREKKNIPLKDIRAAISSECDSSLITTYGFDRGLSLIVDHTNFVDRVALTTTGDIEHISSYNSKLTRQDLARFGRNVKPFVKLMKELGAELSDAELRIFNQLSEEERILLKQWAGDQFSVDIKDETRPNCKPEFGIYFRRNY